MLDTTNKQRRGRNKQKYAQDCIVEETINYY